MRMASEKYAKNINKRGAVSSASKKEVEEASPLSKPMIAFFIFVVVGSAVFGALHYVFNIKM